MSALIRASAVHTEPAPIESVACAARAAERCLAAAGIRSSDVELLINTGVYRERNLSEPALAALIQTEIGANLDPILDNQGSRTFSFDLMNGSVGFLNAAQVAGAMLANGRYRNALIVSNDVHPSVKPAAGFPFSQAGAAVLLEPREEPEAGFQHFAFRTTDRTDMGFRSYFSLNDCRGSEAHNLIKIEAEAEYASRLMEFTVSTVRRFLRERTIKCTEITHIICSRPTASFGFEVTVALSLPPDMILCDGAKDDLHSSSLAAAYHAAQERGQFKRGDAILFIGAGAGLSCGCALYRI
jgi:3-oxoacyl-[acyl-carrier-protein] synthase-3